MKKKLFTVYFALLLSVMIICPVFAAGDLPRLVDVADLLSDYEETALLEELDEIRERQQTDIVVVTVDSLEGESVMDYADDFYDYYGYGFGDERDGILLLISMEERDWYISTSGFGITALTEAGLTYLSQAFQSDLQEGDYAAAFTTFAVGCNDLVAQARTGEPYGAEVFSRGRFPSAQVLRLHWVWALLFH